MFCCICYFMFNSDATITYVVPHILSDISCSNANELSIIIH